MDIKKPDTNLSKEDMDDPVVTEDKIPSYEIVEDQIRQIDDMIIITKVFYLPANLTYRFQLIKKDKMCMMEIPKNLLDELKNNNPASEEKLRDILILYLRHSDCWAEYKG